MTTMEICRGNFILFLTILICSAGIVAQTTNTSQSNQTTDADINSTMVVTTATPNAPEPTNSSTNANDTTLSPGTTLAGTQNSTEMDNSTMTTSPTTKTLETTSVRDYCASTPCINGNCSNGNTSYICVCTPAFTGTNCEDKLVLWPDFERSSFWTSGIGFDTTVSILSTIVPFPYFDNTVNLLFATGNGHVSFGEEFSRLNAPIGTEWPYSPSLFGVYWSDNVKTYGFSSFATTVSYEVRNVTEPSSLVDYVKSAVNEPNFEPLHISIITWVRLTLEDFPNDIATFQLILTTDSEFSYAIKNYQTVWGNTNVPGRPHVSTDYTRENGIRVTGDVPKNITGNILVKLFTKSGTPSKEPFNCVQKTQDVDARLGTAIRSLPVCPCLLALVKTDGWFQSMNTTSACYLSILSDTEGFQQKCCYNRFGLPITNTPEADIPLQVNASGITLRDAFNQCCIAVPQLCSWFYKQFPTSNCSSYVRPFIAGTVGSMHFVTFDNNKYTFYGIGDFVLFKSGNVEVQMRTQRNVNNINTTSLEALAVRIADNTSSFQFYLQSIDLVWNLIPGQNGIPTMGTYKIEQSESGSTLILPTVIVTVSNMTGVLSFTIRTNRRDLNSEGLLGSMDGRADNDFKDINGTVLSGTAENLGAEVISIFAQSCQVLNENDTLFTYPGARSYSQANNNAGYTPLLLPTTVNGILKMFTDRNMTAEAAEIQNLCGDELFCVHEYYISNDNMSATEVLEQSKNISLQKQQSSITAPTFQYLADTIRINATEPTYFLNVNFVNPFQAEFSVVTDDFPGINATMSNAQFLWNVKSDLAKLRALSYPRNLKFYATNEAKLSGEYAPTIYLCLCEQSYQCDLSKLYRGKSHGYSVGIWSEPKFMPNNDAVRNGNVNNVMCNCNGTAGGKFCEKKLDVCLNCYNYTACDVSKVNYCAPCPAGFEGDGKTCLDINECSIKNGGCDHFCTNSDGSFTCSCRPGFTQSGKKCIDINECLLNTDICHDELKLCTNLPGTYSCSCFRGLVGQDRCIRAPYTFTGVINLVDSGNQMWSMALTDTNSTQFKDLSGKVTKSIMDALISANITNSETSYIEILSFTQVQNAARVKRQATTSNTHISAQFVINTANDNVTADTLNNALKEFQTSACNTSCQFGDIILYSDVPMVDSKADLCNYPQIHKCDTTTSYCEQLQETTSCTCKQGFAYSMASLSCRDFDECAGDSNSTCPETGVCVNTFGSYECGCSVGKIWDTNTTMCVADICSTNPCKNDGVCFALNNHEDFACRCSYGWEGRLCEDEDAEAERMKVAVICISVILGVCCLVLLIVLIVLCIRHRRTGSDWNLENDSYTNSRYSEADQLPRAKISHKSGTEMTENGQGTGYERLNHGRPDDKQAAFGRHSPTPGSKNEGTKNVYQNRAYEDELGERL